VILHRLVHHAFLVGQLAHGGGAGGVDDDGRVDLPVTGRPGFVEEELDESAHEPRAVAHVERESGPRHLRAPPEVEEMVETGDFVMRLGVRRHGLGRTVRGEDDVLLGGAALRHAGMRDVGQREHDGAPLRIELAHLRLPRLHLRGNGLHLLHLRQKLRRALFQGGHFVVGRLLFGAKRLDFGQLRTPLRVERQHSVEIDVEVFLGNRRADDLGRFAKEFGVEHKTLRMAGRALRINTNLPDEREEAHPSV
jgi:hypothetical protein